MKHTGPLASTTFANGDRAGGPTVARSARITRWLSRRKALHRGQPGYEIEVDIPEFTSVCPKTGLPDFGTIWIRYVPNKSCMELKSLKEYINEYRNLGIFQENVVNQILEDVVKATKPVWCEVRGEFRPRGGLGTLVEARWPRKK